MDSDRGTDAVSWNGRQQRGAEGWSHTPQRSERQNLHRVPSEHGAAEVKEGARGQPVGGVLAEGDSRNKVCRLAHSSTTDLVVLLLEVLKLFQRMS